jgi:hypothetical protein
MSTSDSRVVPNASESRLLLESSSAADWNSSTSSFGQIVSGDQRVAGGSPVLVHGEVASLFFSMA